MEDDVLGEWKLMRNVGHMKVTLDSHAGASHTSWIGRSTKDTNQSTPEKKTGKKPDNPSFPRVLLLCPETRGLHCQ